MNWSSPLIKLVLNTLFIISLYYIYMYFTVCAGYLWEFYTVGLHVHVWTCTCTWGLCRTQSGTYIIMYFREPNLVSSFYAPNLWALSVGNYSQHIWGFLFVLHFALLHAMQFLTRPDSFPQVPYHLCHWHQANWPHLGWHWLLFPWIVRYEVSEPTQVSWTIVASVAAAIQIDSLVLS
jgi:hypothetical protein